MVELLANNPLGRYAVAQLAEALPRSMGGRELEFRWDYWDISLTYSLAALSL